MGPGGRTFTEQILSNKKIFSCCNLVASSPKLKGNIDRTEPNWDSLAANNAPREYSGEYTPSAFTVLIPVY
jgi:hypothetical protein